MPGFKPMVKMDTTEPSVMLKLKKGGTATHKRAMAESHGFKPMKKQTGGAIDAMAREPMPTTPMGAPAAARAMATRRMAAKRPAPMPRGTPAIGRPRGPAIPSMGVTPMAAPAPTPMPAPTMMKKGGKTAVGVGKKLAKHASMPASKAHKGLKTGGVVKSPKPGEYKTGGVVNGQGGYKGGGQVTDTERALSSGRKAGSGQVTDREKGYKTGGIIKTTAEKTTKMSTAHVDRNSAPTGDVRLGNAGGYKEGGMAGKKHYATGGVVDSGRPVAMSQGHKPPSSPVSTNRLSGTFKTGGRIKGKKDDSC